MILCDFLSASWIHCLVTGLMATILLPTVFVPLSNRLTKRKRSIPRQCQAMDKHELPSDYWTVVVRAIVIVGLSTGLLLGFAARRSNFDWEYQELTLTNTLGAGLFCACTREFLNYWTHRLLHSRLLYKYVHVHHHAIAHPGSGSYDGLYGHVLDSILGMFVLYIPFGLFPRCHVLVLVLYLAVYALFGIWINHCGREFQINFLKFKIYDSTDHDNHHVYRHGNYSDFLPILDQVFGTELIVQKQVTVASEQVNTAKSNSHSHSHGVSIVLSNEELAEIEKLASRCNNSTNNNANNPSNIISSSLRRLSTTVTSSSTWKRFSAQLLEEHPDCRPDVRLLNQKVGSF